MKAEPSLNVSAPDQSVTEKPERKTSFCMGRDLKAFRLKKKAEFCIFLRSIILD